MMCVKILSSNQVLIPSNSVTAVLMKGLEKISREAGGQQQDPDFLIRVKAVVYHYLIVPAASLILFPVTACADLIGRTMGVAFNRLDEGRRVYVIGLISLMITLPLRMAGYLLGHKDLLFPIDYKFKSDRWKIHPLLEMLKLDKAAQEKFDRFRPFEAEIKSDMNELEKVLFDLALVPGGVHLIQSDGIWFWPQDIRNSPRAAAAVGIPVNPAPVADPFVRFCFAQNRVDLLSRAFLAMYGEQKLASAITQEVVRTRRRELITREMPDNLLSSIQAGLFEKTRTDPNLALRQEYQNLFFHTTELRYGEARYLFAGMNQQDLHPIVDFWISQNRVDILIRMCALLLTSWERDMLSSAIAHRIVAAHRRELITRDMPDDLLCSIQESLFEKIYTDLNPALRQEYKNLFLHATECRFGEMRYLFAGMERQDFRLIVDFWISLNKVDILVRMRGAMIGNPREWSMLSSAIVQGVVAARRRELITRDMPDDLLHSIAQKHLEEGIEIPQDTIAKIQELMPKILRRQLDDELRWHTNGHNKVFSLASVPNLVFKMAPSADELREIHREQRARERQSSQHPESFRIPGFSLELLDMMQGIIRIFPSSEAQSNRRFQNMVKAQAVCLTHQFNHLVVPHAKKFNVKGETLIAEERINISTDRVVQKELYRHLSPLDAAIKELAQFILTTGFNDVEWRNVPLINGEPQGQGSTRIALIDLEHMGNISGGIFGDSSTGSRGLVKCLFSEEQIDVVLNEANRWGVVRSEEGVTAEEAKARRMEKIRKHQRLQQFYQEKGIWENPQQPIENTAHTMGLIIRSIRPLTELRLVLLSQLIPRIISQINENINRAPKDLPVKNKRKISLRLMWDELPDFNPKGLVQQILEGLVAQGHLFGMKQKGEYFIAQA